MLTAQQVAERQAAILREAQERERAERQEKITGLQRRLDAISQERQRLIQERGTTMAGHSLFFASVDRLDREEKALKYDLLKLRPVINRVIPPAPPSRPWWPDTDPL